MSSARIAPPNKLPEREGRLKKLGLSRILSHRLRSSVKNPFADKKTRKNSASPTNLHRDGSRFNARIKRDAADGDRERSHPDDRPLRFTE